MLWLIVVIIIVLLYVYWRYFYFFRDPERKIPSGKNIVSPADGTIVYVNLVKDGKLPIVVKKGKRIKLEEITKTKLKKGKHWHIGIFMCPFDLHVNRAPLKGKVEFVKHYKHKDFSMNWTGVRKIFHLKPLYKDAVHIWQNERNTVLFKGVLPVYVVQIADAYVNKIVCNIKKGDKIEKGQRYGMIKMGSQVDLIIPYKKNVKVLVKEFDKVEGGSSVIAVY